MTLKGRKSARVIDAGYASPSNYTPSSVGGEGTNMVSAHLKGVDTALGSVPGGGGDSVKRTITQASHGFAAKDVVRYNGSAYVKAQADTADNAEAIGIVESVSGDDFVLVFSGRIVTLTGLTAGSVYFLSAGTAGLLTTTEPTDSGTISKPMLVATATTEGVVINYRGLIGAGGEGAGYMNVIASNLTLYVATTGSDTTGDGSSGNPWATPQKALDYLKDKWINDDATVTIQCADGTYTGLTAIEIKHPCGARITITGENTYTKTVSSVVDGVTGSAGAWVIVLNMSDVTNIAVNDYVLIRGTTGGTNPVWLRGCHKVTNVDSGNSRITILNKSLVTAYTANPGANTTTDCVVIKTILSFSATAHGVIAVSGHRLGSLNKVILASTATATYYALTVNYTGSALFLGTSVGVDGWYGGITSIDNGHVTCASICISGNAGWGITSLNNSSIECASAVISGNTLGGINCYQHSVMNAGAITIAGLPYASGYCINCASGGAVLATSSVLNNAYFGVYITTGATVYLDSSTVTNMGHSGLILYSQSTVSSISATVTYCITYGIYASGYAYIAAHTCTMSNNGTNYSPLVNTQGNEFAYIDA